MADSLPSSGPAGSEPPAGLSSRDAVSIMVGIVVGASIFKVPGVIFSNVATPLDGLLVWLAGAVVCLSGALTYAELATLHGRSGGEYIYLSRAYGPAPGFLFGWAQLTGVFSGSIGSMACVFADYGTGLLNLKSESGLWLAVLAILGLTGLHLTGIRMSRSAQNVLTGAKLLGIVLLLIVGLAGSQPLTLTETHPVNGPGAGLAMILVLYAFGGWNDAAFVATEIRESHRNIPKALLTGIGLITLIYLLLNVAYLRGLGFEGLRGESTPAAALVRSSTLLSEPLQQSGTKLISLLVMISTLGAVHGLLFTGSRLYAALGRDHALFALLSRWHPQLGAPLWSLVAQALLSVLLILLVGTTGGRQLFDTMLGVIGRPALEWEGIGGSFETLVAATAPVFWGFFLLSGLSLFVFRMREPALPRPFKVPLYPLTPAVFCAGTGYMLYASLDYARDLALLALVPLLFGLPLFWISRWSGFDHDGGDA